jgi:hypothetical protein
MIDGAHAVVLSRDVEVKLAYMSPCTLSRKDKS